MKKAEKIERAKALLAKLKKLGFVVSVDGNWVMYVHPKKEPMPVEHLIESGKVSNEMADLVRGAASKRVRRSLT